MNRILALGLFMGLAAVALAQEPGMVAGLATPIQDPVGLALGTGIVWVATWVTKKLMKDSLEAVWIPKVTLLVSMLFNQIYAGVHSGMSWKVAGSAAIVAVVQALLATGGHENVAPHVESAMEKIGLSKPPSA